METQIKVGTFGFMTNEKDECRPRGMEAHVEHVLPHGLLMVHESWNKRAYAVIGETSFEPSRDAYFSLGSYVEPEWEGETCRCTNIWWGGDPELTDEQALNIMGVSWDQVRQHFNL